MKLSVKDINLAQNGNQWGVWFNIPNTLVDKFKKLAEKDCVKSIEIKQYREKRSLSANAYCWVLCDKIAKVLDSTAEEVYIDKLHDYGTCEYIGCLPDIIPELKKTIKVVEVKGKCMINGKQGVTLKLIRGSSTYDSKEMSTFIEGLVNDAKVLKIETMVPEELKRMMESYEGGK